MAKLQSFRPRIEVEATIKLNLDEMRALDALTGYGVDKLIEHFYKHMGESYLKPYEHGLRSFLQAAASVSLAAADEAERVLSEHYEKKARALLTPKEA